MAHVPDAFERELVAALPRVRAACLAWTRNEDRAADLVQSAVERALKNRDSYALGSNMAAWVTFIARNVFYSERRRDWRWQQPPVVRGKDGEEVEAFDLLLTVKPVGTTRLELGELLEAMSYLPADQQEAILMVAEGLSYEDVAVAVGTETGTVKSRVSRGRAQLETYFGLNIIENRSAA